MVKYLYVYTYLYIYIIYVPVFPMVFFHGIPLKDGFTGGKPRAAG